MSLIPTTMSLTKTDEISPRESQVDGGPTYRGIAVVVIGPFPPTSSSSFDGDKRGVGPAGGVAQPGSLKKKLPALL